MNINVLYENGQQIYFIADVTLGLKKKPGYAPYVGTIVAITAIVQTTTPTITYTIDYQSEDGMPIKVLESKVFETLDDCLTGIQLLLSE